MEFVLIGTSHKTCPVEVREAFTVDEKKKRLLLKSFLFGESKAEELVWLSTCNRVDVYAVCKDAAGAEAFCRAFREQSPDKELPGLIYQKTGKDALRHLLNVVGGLDSMVVGESEILGQVKNAYTLSRSAGTSGRITHMLFQKALSVGKFVRAQTRISQGGRSVASVAAQLAERIFGDMSKAEVLLLGAGEMAEDAAAGFAAKNARLTILNRTLSKGRELAARFSAACEPWENLRAALAKADVVLASTSSPEPVITAEMIKEIAAARHGKPLFLVDISVPRNIQAEAGHFSNVYRYDIDDLQRIVNENLASLSGEIEKVEKIIQARTEEIWNEFTSDSETAEGTLPVPLLLGTRGSKLALVQSDHIRKLLKDTGIASENKIIKTSGDKFMEESAEKLVALAGKGVFVKEIEQELLEGKIQMAMHSLKDMPGEVAPGLILAAYLEREDPRDALITRSGLKLADLPSGSRIATGSLRRKWQISRLRPDMEFVPVRGNIDTRINKLQRGDFDALVVAYAALKRLGLGKSATQIFSTDEMVPAPGQGIVAVEAAEANIPVLKLLRRLDHARSRLAAECERLFLEALGGGCTTPLGAHASVNEDGLLFKIFWATNDGKKRMTMETYVDCSKMKETILGLVQQIKPLI